MLKVQKKLQQTMKHNKKLVEQNLPKLPKIVKNCKKQQKIPNKSKQAKFEIQHSETEFGIQDSKIEMESSKSKNSKMEFEIQNRSKQQHPLQHL